MSENKLKKRIADSLLAARRKSGKRQKEVGIAIGKSEKAISSWENAISQPDAESLIKLAIEYNYATINEMLGYDVLDKDLPINMVLNHDEQQLIENYRSLDDGCKRMMYLHFQNVLDYLQKNSAEVTEDSGF